MNHFQVFIFIFSWTS